MLKFSGIHFRVSAMKITLLRPQKKDTAELRRFFFLTITHTFEQDDIGNRHEGIREEVEKQIQFLRQDFESNGTDVFFLIAENDKKIIGTIAFGKPSDLIIENIKIDLKNVPEITSAYVLPEFQEKGVGTLLFQTMITRLKNKNISEVYLDGGYKKSQSFWIRKLGEPNVTLENYWGKDLHYMIWHRKLKEV